ncbi:MAG: hypothetical protein K6E50_05155 [Lachnospiraceae bacterium]|nr:hypothetical protein [Lachnospiraceae bacterium]
MEDQKETIEKIRLLIRDSNRIVVMIGVGAVIESGGENLWSSRECYRIEEAYHKSPDEMMSVGYYSARSERFFDFYKREILGPRLTPAPLFKYVKRLQKTGKIRKIITQSYYDLSEQAGLRDVVALHGTIKNNHCTHCGKEFSVDYIRESSGVPICDDCKAPIRPGILLLGETIHNDLMTEAVNACEEADLILVLGTNMNDNMVRYCTGNYEAEHIVLITKEEHYSDKYADIVLHGIVSETLPLVID